MRLRSVRVARVWLFVGTVLLASAVTDKLGLTHTRRLLTHVDHHWALVAAFPMGHLGFGWSVLLCRLSLREAWRAVIVSIRLVYLPFAGETMLFYGLVAFAEELMFRGVLLPTLGGNWFGLLAQTLAFVLSHRLERPALMRILDLVTLALGLGAAALWLDDWWPLVIVHWVRNVSCTKVIGQKTRGVQGFYSLRTAKNPSEPR